MPINEIYLDLNPSKIFLHFDKKEWQLIYYLFLLNK